MSHGKFLGLLILFWEWVHMSDLKEENPCGMKSSGQARPNEIGSMGAEAKCEQNGGLGACL